jgi:hypothetical protein
MRGSFEPSVDTRGDTSTRPHAEGERHTESSRREPLLAQELARQGDPTPGSAALSAIDYVVVGDRPLGLQLGEPGVAQPLAPRVWSLG